MIIIQLESKRRQGNDVPADEHEAVAGARRGRWITTAWVIAAPQAPGTMNGTQYMNEWFYHMVDQEPSGTFNAGDMIVDLEK